MDEDWAVPDPADFERVVNIILQLALTHDKALDAYGWVDSKRGNIALKTASREALEAFKQVVRLYHAEPD